MSLDHRGHHDVGYYSRAIHLLIFANIVFGSAVARESVCASNAVTSTSIGVAETWQSSWQDDENTFGLHLLQRNAYVRVKSSHTRSASSMVTLLDTKVYDGVVPTGIVGASVQIILGGGFIFGMLVFLAFYELFSTSSGFHVGDLGSRSSQMLFLLSGFLSTASISVAFTTMVAVINSWGVNVLWCVFFVGADTMARLLGITLGRYLAHPPITCRHTIVFSMALCGLCSLGAAKILQSASFQYAGTLIIVITSLQISSSFFCGLLYVPVAVQAIKTTLSTEMTNLQTLVMLCKTLGFMVPPVLGASSAMPSSPDQVGVGGVLIPLSSLGVTFLACACCASLFSSRQEPPLKNELQDSFDLRREDRQAVVINAALFKVVRMFALAAVNMATPIILIREGGWTLVKTDVATALMLIVSLIWGIAIVITNWAWIPADIHVMRVFCVLGLISAVLFFNLGPLWLLLLVNALTYASAICTIGIAESLAARAAVPISACSLENFQMVSECGVCLSCVCASFFVEAVLTSLGRNAYAFLQILLAFMSMMIAVKLATPVQKDWRYATNIPGSPVQETTRL